SARSLGYRPAVPGPHGTPFAAGLPPRPGCRGRTRRTPSQSGTRDAGPCWSAPGSPPTQRLQLLLVGLKAREALPVEALPPVRVQDLVEAPELGLELGR